MSMRMCPKCGSTNIRTERRINGNNTCLEPNCNYVWSMASESAVKVSQSHPIINDYLPPVYYQRYAIYLDESNTLEERFEALEVCLRASQLSLVYMIDKYVPAKKKEPIGTFTLGDVRNLRAETGIGLMMCKEALDYANGDVKIAKAYIEAKTLAVATRGMTFDQRVQSFMKEGKE